MTFQTPSFQYHFHFSLGSIVSAILGRQDPGQPSPYPVLSKTGRVPSRKSDALHEKSDFLFLCSGTSATTCMQKSIQFPISNVLRTWTPI